METLMDLYNSVESPLDDLDKVKQIIKAYSDSKKNNRDFYHVLLDLNSRGKINPGYGDYSKEAPIELWKFETWKDNIINMTPEKYASFYGSEDGYYSNEFITLRNYLKSIDGKVSIDNFEEIIQRTQSDNSIKKSYEKYDYTINQTGWDYVSSVDVFEDKPFKTQHRLYINCDGQSKYYLIANIIDNFTENGIPMFFKYNAAFRDDTIVMWTDDNNLLKTIDMLKKARKDLPNLSIFEPPILAGRIDGWIGYGSEPTTLLNGERTSFNRIRAKALTNAITNAYSKYVLYHKNERGLSEFEIAERDESFIQSVKDEIIHTSKEYGIDESNFCFDKKTVEQMKQINNGSEKNIVTSETSDTLFEQRRREAILIADELLQKPGIAWEDLLEKDDEKQSYSNEPSSMTEETQDLEAVLVELNKIKENDEKRKVQKQKETQKSWKSKFDKRDKDYYKKAEAYLLGELKRLSPEERKKGNQYLSALENEQNRTK